MQLDADTWEQHVRTQPSPESWAEPFLRYTDPGQTILELGCGGGGLTQHLAAAGRRMIGLDFSIAALKQAEPYCERIILADVLKDWQQFPHSIDWVISCGLLEHFQPQEIRKIMAQSAKVARMGVISEVPNAYCDEYMAWRKAKLADGTWEYGDEFPMRSLEREFKTAGLKYIEETTVDTKSFGSKQGYLLVTRGLT